MLLIARSVICCASHRLNSKTLAGGSCESQGNDPNSDSHFELHLFSCRPRSQQATYAQVDIRDWGTRLNYPEPGATRRNLQDVSGPSSIGGVDPGLASWKVGPSHSYRTWKRPRDM